MMVLFMTAGNSSFSVQLRRKPNICSGGGGLEEDGNASFLSRKPKCGRSRYME